MYGPCAGIVELLLALPISLVEDDGRPLSLTSWQPKREEEPKSAAAAKREQLAAKQQALAAKQATLAKQARSGGGGGDIV